MAPLRTPRPGRPRRPARFPWLAAMLATVGGVVLLGGRSAAPDGAASGRGRRSTPPDPRAKSLGYETEDISARTVARILAGLAGTVIVAVGLLFVMIHFFRSADNADNPVLTAQQSAEVVPPGPHLQSDPYRDLRDLHDAEQQRITGYSWADPDHTRAHIPIARAMALVAGRSLEPSP